ncbi:MAG: TetR family transcriptional regulator [Cellvibrionaceae bacterium]|nr:TetR family transcriptional regulator [Cellvibrionaceae bacterium]
MQESVAAKPKSRGGKGEQTRQQILAAALEVIAAQGYRALTHRAIAKQAGVSLSLTTYHFKDLEALLHDAFAYYKQAILADYESRWQQLKDSKLQQWLAHAAEQDCRQQLCHTLADYLSEIIAEDVKHRGQGVAVEMTFHFDLHLAVEQRNFAYELCNRLHPEIVEFFTKLNTKAPEVDAHLLLDTVHFLRFRCLAVPTMVTAEDAHKRLLRLLQTLLVCK